MYSTTNYSKMNFIAFAVLVLCSVTFSQQQDTDIEAFKKKMREEVEACIQESGVDPTLPEKAFMEGQFPDDKNLKCFFKCKMQKDGRMDSNGNLDFSKALGHLPPKADKEKITAAVNKCKDSKGADACETAFLASKCLREAIGPLHEHGN